jgi:hypothetical protein
MSTRVSGASEFLFGRSRTVSLWIIAAGLLVAISVGLVGRMIPLGAIIVYRSDIAGVLTSIILLVGAAVIAYFNSGYVIVVLIHAVVLFFLFTSGGVAGYAGASLIESIRLMIRFAIIIGVLLSTIGYLIGTGVRSVLNDQ